MTKKIFSFLLLLFLFSSCDVELYKDYYIKKSLPFLEKFLSAKLIDKIKKNQTKPEIPTIIVQKKNTQDTSFLKRLDENKKKYNEEILFLFHKKYSKEKRDQFYFNQLQELIASTQNTRPSRQFILKMLSNVKQGGSIEGIYHSLILDRSKRVSNSSKLNQEEIESFKKTLLLFGNRKLTAKKIDFDQEMAKKTINSVLLDSIDSFIYENHFEDLHVWYAHYSLFLLKNCKNKFNRPTRINNDYYFHYDWSKRVPLLVLKSEVIIKTNKCYNE